MKKVTRIVAIALLAVMAVMALASCGSNAKELVGKWEYTESYEGMEMTMVMEFTDDGKMSASVNGISVGSGEYKVEGNKVANNMNGEWTEYVEFSVDGDKLSLTFDGEPLVLTKVK